MNIGLKTLVYVLQYGFRRGVHLHESENMYNALSRRLTCMSDEELKLVIDGTQTVRDLAYEVYCEREKNHV